MDDGRPCSGRRTRPVRRPAGALPRGLPGATRPRPRLRPGHQPHPPAWDRHETARARGLPARARGSRSGRARPATPSGCRRDASPRLVAQRIEARTGRRVSEIPPFALTVTSPGRRWPPLDSRRQLGRAAPRQLSPPLVHAERPARRAPVVPQPHSCFRGLGPVAVPPERSRGRDRLRASTPTIRSSKVRSPAGTSFVGSSWQSDTNGHGTFVAGEIAAALNNEQGMAGIAFPAELLVAKVVRSDGTISPDAEARAIHWAVDHGARVINLSFGGMRDPADRSRDTYSPLEAAAVQYAVSNGVLVVAAVGNGDGAPEQPWSYAGYPAALPHVLGVSAVARDGSVPAFSNRDVVYNDLSAPGEGILSTLPRAITSSARPGCVLQGYSDCGPIEFRRGEGTSFSAPQVSAAAALMSRRQPAAPAGSGRRAADALGQRRGARQRLRALLARPRLADRLGRARRRGARSGRSTGRSPRRIASRPTTRPRPPPGSGAARAAGSRRRSTTGTTRSTSTRSSFGAASVWWRGSAARAAPIRISSCGSPEHDGWQAPRSIAACSPRSPRLPAPPSEFGCVRRRPAGTSSR